MTEKDWDTVLRNNSLLCGTRFSAESIGKVRSIKIHRAVYPRELIFNADYKKSFKELSDNTCSIFVKDAGVRFP